MPELPEVHTITSDLKKNIVGFKITNVQISKYYGFQGNVIKELKLLIGKKIVDVNRVAKNIVIKLDNGCYLVFHLAMTGRILLHQLKDKPDNWVKLVLEIHKGTQKLELRFTDMREFGKVVVIDDEKLDKLSSKYGLSPLDKNITAEKFLSSIKKRKTNIKNAILDQSIISGLGNIYATDALFLAKINPTFPTQKLTLPMAEKLLEASREILKEGIKHRGSTLPDKMYVDIFGKAGNQQKHFKIYLKNICDVCNSKVEYTKISGRGTYFCPVCQKSLPSIK